MLLQTWLSLTMIWLVSYESPSNKNATLNNHAVQVWSQNENCRKVPTWGGSNVFQCDKVLPQCHM
jgi:hypothetical protein